MLLTNLKLITPSKCAASRFLPTLFMMSATGEKYATLFHSDLCRQSLKGLENKYSCFHIMHWPLDIFLFQTRIRKCNWILRRLISHHAHFSKGSAIKVHFSLLQKRKKIALICVIKCKKSDTLIVRLTALWNGTGHPLSILLTLGCSLEKKISPRSVSLWSPLN